MATHQHAQHGDWRASHGSLGLAVPNVVAKKVCPHWQFGTVFAIDGLEAGGAVCLLVQHGGRYISHSQAAQSLTARRLCGILMAQHGIGKWRSHTLCMSTAQVTHLCSRVSVLSDPPVLRGVAWMKE